jgi:hypothetical protein
MGELTPHPEPVTGYVRNRMGMRYMQYYLMYTFLVSRLRGDLNTIFSAGGRKTKPVFIYLEFYFKNIHSVYTVLCVYCRIGVREKTFSLFNRYIYTGQGRAAQSGWIKWNFLKPRKNNQIIKFKQNRFLTCKICSFQYFFLGGLSTVTCPHIL